MTLAEHVAENPELYIPTPQEVWEELCEEFGKERAREIVNATAAKYDANKI